MDASTQYECVHACGISAAIYESGEAVLFIPQTGEVVTCAAEAAYEWLDCGTGELDTILGRLGILWMPERYTTDGVPADSTPVIPSS